MKKIILSFILIIIFVSGCTDLFGGSKRIEYENDIVIIKQIKAVPETVVPGQLTRIIASIQNIGKEPIKNLEVRLYDYCEGTFRLIHVSQPYNTVCYDESTYEKRGLCEIKQLLPGEIKEITWTLEPGIVSFKTICPSDGMKVYVRYNYSTISSTTISFISPEEYLPKYEEGKIKTTQSQITIGQGPIKPYIEVTDTQPILTDSGITTISLHILNRGSGFLKSNKISKENIKISLPDGLNPENCPFNMTEDNIYILNDDVTFIGGSHYELPCRLIITDNLKNQITKETTRLMTINISYTYEFDAFIPVIIEPK